MTKALPTFNSGMCQRQPTCIANPYRSVARPETAAWKDGLFPTSGESPTPTGSLPRQ